MFPTVARTSRRLLKKNNISQFINILNYAAHKLNPVSTGFLIIYGFVGVLFWMIDDRKDIHKPDGYQGIDHICIKFVGGIDVFLVANYISAGI